MSTYILIPLTEKLSEYLALEYIAAAKEDLILEEFFKGIKVEIPQEVKDGMTLIILPPRVDDRWDCESPESPDGKCDYNHPDGSYDEDDCRYCGQPDERK